MKTKKGAKNKKKETCKYLSFIELVWNYITNPNKTGAYKLF